MLLLLVLSQYTALLPLLRRVQAGLSPALVLPLLAVIAVIKDNAVIIGLLIYRLGAIYTIPVRGGAQLFMIPGTSCSSTAPTRAVRDSALRTFQQQISARLGAKRSCPCRSMPPY